MRSIASDRVDSLLIRTKGKRVRAPELKCSRINEILHHYYSKFRKISSSSVDVVVRKEEEIEVRLNGMLVKNIWRVHHGVHNGLLQPPLIAKQSASLCRRF